MKTAIAGGKGHSGRQRQSGRHLVLATR